jgi:hypothetical protein
MTFKLLPNGTAQCIVLKKGSGASIFTRPKWQTRCVVVDPARRLLEYSNHAGSPVKGTVDLRGATITLPPDSLSACAYREDALPTALGGCVDIS